MKVGMTAFVATRKRKCPEIPLLEDYAVAPPEEFWSKFPYNGLPEKIECSINVPALGKLIELNSNILTECEIARAKTCIKYLLLGANSCQKVTLPACHLENAKSSIKNGPEITDEVACWTKKKFVSGPFKNPPFNHFRVNPLMAIEQLTKVRPVLNVSLPRNNSFNDNVDENLIEKVKMSSARKFSYSLVKCGKGSIMSKFDMVDAYKNIPAPLQDLRLQGFCWLSMFFVELRQIFGAKTAVANFDILGNTILSLTKNLCKIPAEFVHRTLDDVPFVAPLYSNCSDRFVKTYMDICESINVSLAPVCPSFDKAFCKSTQGKVLGINFNSNALTWSLPKEKRRNAILDVQKCKEKSFVSIKQFQSLMGKLNDISVMCPFLKCFKFPLYTCLANAQVNDGPVVLDEIAKEDLCIWERFLLDEKEMPICHEYVSPPLCCKSFTSDAAGSNSNSKWKIGCGSVGFDHNGEIIFAYQMFWPQGILEKAYDAKNSNLGSKTTTLEFLGILIPFLIIPDSLKNQHVVVKVDNAGCFFGWLNKKTSGDVMASILIRALHVIAYYLECIVHIVHLPRKSSWDAMLTDRLSREKTTTRQDRALLSSFKLPDIPLVLKQWLESPTEDWELPMKLLYYVKNKCEN